MQAISVVWGFYGIITMSTKMHQIKIICIPKRSNNIGIELLKSWIWAHEGRSAHFWKYHTTALEEGPEKYCVGEVGQSDFMSFDLNLVYQTVFWASYTKHRYFSEKVCFPEYFLQLWNDRDGYKFIINQFKFLSCPNSWCLN